MWKSGKSKYFTSNKTFFIHSETGECRWNLPNNTKATPLPSRMVALGVDYSIKQSSHPLVTDEPLPSLGQSNVSPGGAGISPEDMVRVLKRSIGQPLSVPPKVTGAKRANEANSIEHAKKIARVEENRKIDHLYNTLMRPRICFVASEILRYLLEKQVQYEVQEPFCKRSLKKVEQQRIERVLRSCSARNPSGYDYDSFCEVADTVVLTERWSEQPRSEVDLYQLVLESLDTFELCPRFVDELPLCHFVIVNFVHVVMAVQGI